jgi:hypothetical protein
MICGATSEAENPSLSDLTDCELDYLIRQYQGEANRLAGTVSLLTDERDARRRGRGPDAHVAD